jgi:hypothetical protein
MFFSLVLRPCSGRVQTDTQRGGAADFSQPDFANRVFSAAFRPDRRCG